jgi:predicted XRE-type DNA-binding protein
MKKKTHRSVTRSSGNIFADLGLPHADEHMLKARVAIFIGKRIDELALTQQSAAKRMGLSQPDVSNLLRGRFEGFSLGRLLSCVRALGNDVEIKVKRPSHDDDHEGRMSLMMT